MAKNELVVINDTQKNALAQYTGTLFSDIDFNGLNSIIDRIAENKEELTDGMRAQASQFADDWDNLVVRRLNDKKDKLESLLDFFTSREKDMNYISACIEGRSRYVRGSYIESNGIIFVVESVLRSFKEDDMADELIVLNDEYEEMIQRHKEEEPDRDEYLIDEDNMTFNERVIAIKKFELDRAEYEKTISAEKFQFRKKFIELRKRICSDKKIVDFIKALKSQLRQAKDASAVVHEKSSMVKLAIGFGGTDLLKALQELHEFQKGL